MEVLPHDQFVVRIDGSRRLTRKSRRFLRVYNPVSTSIETKDFHDLQRNIPSSREGNARHQHPDSPVKVTANSNGGNNGETSEHDRGAHSSSIVAPIKMMLVYEG